MIRKAFATWLLLALAVAVWSPSAGAATFSDEFAARETVSALPVEVFGSNLGATAESTDPQAKPFSPYESFHPVGHSIWLEWEAPATQYVTVSLCGSGIQPVLGIYEAPESSYLSEISANRVFVGGDCSPIEDGVTFKAIAGRKYELFVDGDAQPSIASATEGPIAMRIEATPRPANDDFAAAQTLSGAFRSEPRLPGRSTYYTYADGYTWGATVEPGEPIHGSKPSGASIWYRWTAPETGQVEIHAGQRHAVDLAIYRGSSLGALERVFTARDLGFLSVVGGTEYRLALEPQMGDFGPDMGLVWISLAMYKTATLLPVDSPVDRDPPQTKLLGAKVAGRTATVRFRSDEAGRFRCKLDRRKARRCSSPLTYRALALGPHAVKITAIDAAGNADPTPVTARFTIRPPRRHP